MEIGDLAAWVTAVPTWLAVVAVVYTAKQFRRDTDQRHRDAERERRENASGLSAWLVQPCDATTEGKHRYGVIVSNTSGTPFNDVEIQVNLWRKEGEPGGVQRLPPLSLRIVPPGRYYVAWSNPSGKDAAYTWDFPAPVPADTCDYKPFTKYIRKDKDQRSFRVVCLRFRDNDGVRWFYDELYHLKEGEPDTASDAQATAVEVPAEAAEEAQAATKGAPAT